MSQRDETFEANQAEEEEIREWLDSLDSILRRSGPVRVRLILQALQNHAYQKDVRFPFSGNTPYVNSIPIKEQSAYPGDGELEWRIRSLVRWNAMAMVVRANREEDGIGGHISSFASSATLYEVAFNHFFKGVDCAPHKDLIFFQGHCAPGIYARAFLEGRLSEDQLKNFRRELKSGGGLSSYPHPWLMGDFWEFPTVSMGLGPLMAIYQARFARYLEDRGLKPKSEGKVWAFLGDGEMDEPESLGAISLAAREKLDNLIFVINCNLQRLDGPVRGNGKIIQELESNFRGAGWNVIKVIWGDDWDPLLANDKEGFLVRRMNEVLDGEYQKYSVEDGAYIREHFFGKYPELKAMVSHLSDAQLRRLRRGGHDPLKIYAAYKAATEHVGAPTVVLAKTIKGYGLGEAGEGRNVTHQQKKLNEDELREFRARFGIPISDEEVAKAPFYKPSDSSPEIKYMKERRKALGGGVPRRVVKCEPLKPLSEELFEEFYKGTEGREVSTTMAFVRILSKLLKDPQIGKLVVPIVSDEARTFGMEALFRQCGIYSHVGQLYEPVDSKSLLYYKEAQDGQILEEGISEAGSLSSWIAGGTAYAHYGVNTIPFFIFYSMFGMQRVGDLVWAAADMRSKGFLLGGTAGRTTLAGEGLQHQDGHSHVLAYSVPTMMAYDPSFAFELAVIIKDGIKRMYVNQEDVFYYLTVGNENYAQPPMPENVSEGILNGMYLFQKSDVSSDNVVNLFGSGAIMTEVLKASNYLREKGVTAHVWSVTSYKNLYVDAQEVDRYNRLHPHEEQKKSYVEKCLGDQPAPVVAASDYMKVLPESIARWLPSNFVALGTDGFGRSEGRASLRDFFEVDWRHIVYAAYYTLFKDDKISEKNLKGIRDELKIEVDRVNPWRK